MPPARVLRGFRLIETGYADVTTAQFGASAVERKIAEPRFRERIIERRRESQSMLH
jgi:hypothetical protein